ncbi:hypothetical protein PtA15_15A82 [Puccinia triticina]|uniref:Uncharacterized protein n=1 Tax=Puccinia triticina TaxID=208348 RepID=A0ABY7D5T5_9BASI|nr:uncharacterized protein PtA15_15A82 [Puccinia triticina]WAQ91691.1 hypothetical protein PtA15_15A82 [Puccinia triticina]WAR62492.1 hypothetical protein PtB15_15B77 [Puccinia triticina]
MPAEDSDAGLEDLDNNELDYSRATTNPDLSSRLGQIDRSYQSSDGENDVVTSCKILSHRFQLAIVG